MKTFYTMIFCIAGIFSSAQFNTLTRNVVKTEDNASTQVNEEEIEVKQISKKDKKTLKNALNITTKSDLKNEIDSLKILIKDIKNEKSSFKQIKDSILVNSQRNLFLTNSSFKESERNYTMYDFIKEPISKIFMPIKNKITITSPFGIRKHPINGTKNMHNGIDIRANYEEVMAVLDGVVVAAGWDSKGGGNFIKINHFDRFETSYLHLHEAYYQTGEIVKAGYVIGVSGNTGSSTGPHLHFSVKEWGKHINPINFLNDIIKVNNLIVMNYE